MSETKPNPMLDAQRYSLAEQKCNVHFITVESVITRAQILHPDFWGHIATKLRPYDEIKIACDDGSYYAKALVLGAERTYARVHILEWHDLTTRDVAQTQDLQSPEAVVSDPLKAYEVAYKGLHRKWCVIRLADAVIIREKELGKKEAQNWLDDYLRVTATT